jgi:predicted acetyltransferase
MVSAETSLKILLRTEKTLSHAEKQGLGSMSSRAFGKDEKEFVEGHELKWGGSYYHFLGMVSGQIISHVGILPRKIRLGGKVVFTAGVGGVATHPEFQRCGFAAELLTESNRWLDRKNAPTKEIFEIAMLFCEPQRVDYYSRFGYQLIHQPLYIRLDHQRARFQDTCMIRTLHSFTWSKNIVDLRGHPW